MPNTPNNNTTTTPTAAQLVNNLKSAASDGVISQATSSLLSGSIGSSAIAGAAGMDATTVQAAEVTLVRFLIDKSSSIGDAGLENAVREGQKTAIEALRGCKERDSILVSTVLFNHGQEVVDSYQPVMQAKVLDANNYRAGGMTHLYDAWCDAVAGTVAYAQDLENAGTPVPRSIVVVITDGEDVGSRSRSINDCAQVNGDLVRSEKYVLAFVGVGNQAHFDRIAREMGFPPGCVLVEKDATANGLRKVFQVVSRASVRASQGQVVPGPTSSFFGQP